MNDPITTEVIRCAFNSVAEELNALLIRSAYSSVIYELADCAVSVLDSRHRVLAESTGVPIFLGNLGACLEITEDMRGEDCWAAGDVWVMNDSYLAGAHLNDLTVYAPVFHRGTLVGFVMSRAHHMDVGGKSPGASTNSEDIYQEGIRIGPTRLAIGGNIQRELLELLITNGRLPKNMDGDLRAQIMLALKGQERVIRLFDRFGVGDIRDACEAVWAQTEARDRQSVCDIPDGTYHARGCLDSDGLTDAPVWVDVSVTVEGDKMRIDLSGSNDAVPGPVNCSRGQAISACRVAFKRHINTHEPVNGGSFRPLEVIVREASLFDAAEPVPCYWYFTSLGLLIDLVTKALSDAVPDSAAAAHYGDSCVLSIAGLDTARNERFVEIMPHEGGWGAWDSSDGQDALINSVNSVMKNFPIEVIESKLPVRIGQYRIREDSGGAGEWRGGCGITRDYILDFDDGQFTVWFERSRTPAWGLRGGVAGRGPQVVLNPGTPNEQQFLKATGVRVTRGDVLRVATGGGGGWGDPIKRSTDARAIDLRDRYVSA